MCLCGTIRQLEADFDPDKATELASELNKHLAAIRSILAKSKSLSREVRYQVIPNNQRTMKISSLKSVDIEGTNAIYDRFKDDANGFWNFDNNGYRELRRRLACVVVYLRSKLDAQSWVPPNLSSIVQGQKPSELRYAGNKYIKMARKLGGVGSILWLPLDVPSSTYERYLNMDDEDVFNHLLSIAPEVPEYNSFRRWTDDGEIQSTSAIDFGLPIGLIGILSDDECLKQVAEHPEITQNTLDDGALTWSLNPESLASFSGQLSAQTEEDWATIGLKLLCFTCPPCYEGKVNWPPQTKKAIWALLDKATDRKRIPVSLKPQIIDALLFFSERDFFAIRCVAVERARSFLRKSMSYYYHASVTLFESIMLRLDGHLDKSDAKIKDFMEEYNDTGTRCDNALLGRLHISNIENKIHRYDTDVASCMYQWEGVHPLSTFEIEVTRRLQGTAARFFHSVGDFQTAQASLEQHLWLNSTKPIRPNTRLLIVTRLAEIHCELQDYEKALQVLQPELDGIPQKKGRPFRRLSMVMVEAYIGLGSLDPAESILQLLLDVEPPELDDINDQMLHMRRLILVARVAHERLYFDQALHLWQLTLQMMEQLSIFKARHPWIAAIIYLSMAHLQLTLGDTQNGRLSWDAAVEISMRERYEYVIPILATGWLRKVVGAIHQEQGWPFRVMLPGGKPDMTWQ
ncbi:hypothetical protein NM208_g2263 [Fusarium decemcellulare]|uniref:Uncharacterized protein n=1 Tax=Fusarium decemcellulare TaxID=57161 RepID=A0ACC1STQ6_9HYPO|nr:hypothetical protein NM208_g2263 [Fusarium decemcellulare]